MKRDELIQKLQELPEDAEIVIETGCSCCADEEDILDFQPVGDEKLKKFRIY